MTVKENLASFYRFAEIQVIKNEDVWMRFFVQILDGDARDYFKDLPPRSINKIDALDDSFLRHWRNKRDILYYITEFGALKREGESVSDFLKGFNEMYKKIPAEIKPIETSAKMTYANAFNPDFCLLLRERRATSLAHMQDVAIDVVYNILVVDKLRN
jgi:hypothetical protein